MTVRPLHANTIKPVVSVIVPVLDPRPLEYCLDALRRQSYPASSFEVIVVDNGCPRPLPASRDPLLIVCREHTVGSYAARNRGITTASGSILAFTDADCIPASDWIENAVQHLSSQPGCGLLAGRIEVVVPQDRPPNVIERVELATAFRQQSYVSQAQFGATANLFVRREIVERVGPFDPSLLSFGDREWCWRAHLAGYELEFARDVLVRHPARSSWAEYSRRLRRTTGGYYELLRSGRVPKSRLLRDARLAIPVDVLRDQPNGHPRLTRLAVSALAAAGVAVRFGELLRRALLPESRKN